MKIHTMRIIATLLVATINQLDAATIDELKERTSNLVAPKAHPQAQSSALENALQFFEYDSNLTEMYTPIAPATRANILKIAQDYLNTQAGIPLKNDIQALQNLTLTSPQAQESINPVIRRLQELTAAHNKLLKNGETLENRLENLEQQLNNAIQPLFAKGAELPTNLTLNQQLSSLLSPLLQRKNFTGSKGSVLAANLADPRKNYADLINTLYAADANGNIPDSLRIQYVPTTFHPNGVPRTPNRTTADIHHLKSSSNNDRIVVCVDQRYFPQTSGNSPSIAQSNMTAMTGYLGRPYTAVLMNQKQTMNKPYLCFIYQKYESYPATIEVAPQQ